MNMICTCLWDEYNVYNIEPDIARSKRSRRMKYSSIIRYVSLKLVQLFSKKKNST